MKDGPTLVGCAGCLSVFLALFIVTAAGTKDPDREGFLVLLLLVLLIVLGVVGFKGGPRPEGLWKCESCGQSNEEGLTGCVGCGKDRA
ncbi:MAG TPA: hypothetical protein VFS19_03610 [Planctomycetota bacterium]|nr:hypothetical protein [Planctomycetota bacterium]